jgi:hypothetical protein
MKAVQEHYPGWKRLALYLTPDGSRPSHPDYVPVSYRLVCDVVEDMAEARQSALDPAVPMLLRHYARMLRRHVVADSEIADLCRTIYRKHQRALELIYEHRPDDQDTMREFLEGLVESGNELVMVPSPKGQVLFTVPEWALGQLNVVEGSSSPGSMLVFGFTFGAKHLDLSLWIGPGPKDIRDALAARAKEVGRPLGIKGTHGINWTTIFSRRLLQANDYDVLTSGEREDHVREQWDTFLAKDLLVIRTKLTSPDVAAEVESRGGL